MDGWMGLMTHDVGVLCLLPPHLHMKPAVGIPTPWPWPSRVEFDSHGRTTKVRNQSPKPERVDRGRGCAGQLLL